MEAIMEVTDWLEKVSRGHKFGTKDSYSKGNNNLDLTVARSIVLNSEVSGSLRIPAGTDVCIFRKYERHGGNIIATFFLGEALVNVLAGGGWTHKPVGGGARL